MRWLKRLGWPSGYTAPCGACALGALGGPWHRAATGPGELSGRPPPPRVSQGEQELCRPEAGSQTFGQVTFFFFYFSSAWERALSPLTRFPSSFSSQFFADLQICQSG